MLAIYVGDSKNVIRRIRHDHCKNNVEGSALRKYIAIRKGYTFIKTRRFSGKMRTRLDLPNPGDGEKAISDYLRLGIWKFVFCSSYAEAHDFQLVRNRQTQAFAKREL